MLQSGVIRSYAFDTIKPKKLKFESCFFYLVKDQNTELFTRPTEAVRTQYFHNAKILTSGYFLVIGGG